MLNDPEQSYATGLAQFFDEESYKPAHEPFKLKRAAVAGTPGRRRQSRSKSRHR